MQRVTLKTSTIFISKGDKTRVYFSVGDVPQTLRKELEESTNSFNSATILIADRRGREEIRRALNGLPSLLRTRLTSSLPPAGADLAESERTPKVPPYIPSISGELRRMVGWALVSLAVPAAGLWLWFFLANN
jgi:hypothetical protein